MYVGETWAMGMEGERRKEGTDMRMLRRIYVISLNDKWWSEDLRNMKQFPGLYRD